MRRYFFDLSDGTQERDERGTEFADAQAAQREAVRYAGEIMRFEPFRLEHGDMRVNVRDDAGTTLFSVSIRLDVETDGRT